MQEINGGKSTKEDNQRIFLDYAAGTPVSEKALDAYVVATKYFANPQALHTQGLEALRCIETARHDIAKNIGVKTAELVFTSGGTESNNLAIAGCIQAIKDKGVVISACHVVVSSIEHPSVIAVLEQFVAQGLSITTVAPNEHGEINPEAVSDALQENTILVSIALVNSEIGTVQPIHAISKVLHAYAIKHNVTSPKKILFHVDAGQGLYQTLMPNGFGIDLMSFDSGKMYGPRGVGALYIRQGTKIAPVLRGGNQEQGIRPGTENTALIVGFSAAFSECVTLRISESERLTTLRDMFVSDVQEMHGRIVINGTAKKQSSHIVNISIPHIDAEYIAMYLDQRGIALSTKSACLERANMQESTVVATLGKTKDNWRAKNTLRFSFGRDTTKDMLIETVEKLKEALEKYQTFSKL